MLLCVGVKCTAAIHLFRGRGMVIDKTYFKPKTFCYLYSLLPTPPTTHIVSHLTQWHTLTFLGLICLEVVRSFELIKKWKAPWTKEVPCAKQINLYNYELTSPRPSPSPKSKPRIPKSQNQKGKPYLTKLTTPMQLLHSSIAIIIIVQTQKEITFLSIRDSNTSSLRKGN